MLASGIVGKNQDRRPRTRSQYLLRGLQKGAHLGIAVGGPLDCIAVNAERDVVKEQPAVYLRHVDLALDPIAERAERARHVISVHPHVKREMIARPGGNAHEREIVRSRGRGHDCQGPIATGHAEGIRAAGHCSLSERCEALARDQDDNLDALLARQVNDPVARGRAPARSGIDKQHRL